MPRKPQPQLHYNVPSFLSHIRSRHASRPAAAELRDRTAIHGTAADARARDPSLAVAARRSVCLPGAPALPRCSLTRTARSPLPLAFHAAQPQRRCATSVRGGKEGNRQTERERKVSCCSAVCWQQAERVIWGEL